ncbi:MAG TPA: hypothetical protein VMG60_18490 [Burkholderiaceae bacterium]|nr:hypothetical protein [Burkholderiaceae bacterium]
MSYFVVVPGALVPASIAPRLLARAKLPRLARKLQRALVEEPVHMSGDGAAHLDWLWSRFGAPAARPVTAPYAWRALNHASALEMPSDQPIWHADPVHFAFARDHILVAGFDRASAIAPDESRELAAEAAALLAGFGASLRVLDASHWFLSFDPPWQQITTVAFDAALGRSLERVLPAGDAAARWRKLLTEVQIAWHQHPVNRRREAAGVQTINGLWLHGGGAWRELPRRAFGAVATDDAVVRGWALASGVAPSALLPLEGKPAGDTASLVYLPLLHPLASQNEWDGWLDALLQLDARIEDHVAHAFAHGSGEVVLVLTGREVVRSVSLRRSDTARIWRRNSIAELFSEPEPS